MATTTTAVAVSLTTGVGIAGSLLFINPYIPYLLGGIALVGYMVSHGELCLKSMQTIYVILGALVMGFFTHDIALMIGDVGFGYIVTHIPADIVKHSEAIRSGNVPLNIADGVSFAMGGLSRNVFLRFFGSRDKIVDKLGGKK